MGKKEGKMAGYKRLMVACLFLAICFGTSFTGRAESAELHAVIFNAKFDKKGAPRTFPQFSLEKEYGITEHRYWPSVKSMKFHLKDKGITPEEWEKQYADAGQLLDDKFLEDLNKSKLLYIGQYVYYYCGELFANPKCADGLKTFLERGGTILFDYYSSSGSGFLSPVGVEIPVSPAKSISYTAVSIWPENKNMSLLNNPYEITESVKIKSLGSHGSWEKWSAKQVAPLRGIKNPEKEAIFIVQENVLGAGKIIFNQTITTFRKRSEFTDNIIYYAFGPEPFKKIIQSRMKIISEWKTDVVQMIDKGFQPSGTVKDAVATAEKLERQMASWDTLSPLKKIGYLFCISEEMVETMDRVKGEIEKEKLFK